jgi:amino-acid N-acetyltransferase
MTTGRIAIRAGEAAHAPRLHALIEANREDGHLLPRTPADLEAHAGRFTVALRGRQIVGCAELAPLSAQVAEVRSLVVDRPIRGRDVGRRLVDDLYRRARAEGYETLCAFTHAPACFIRMGFSIVPHLWLPEKIATDCATCSRFRRCGQFAMVRSVDEARDRATQPAVWAAHLA